MKSLSSLNHIKVKSMFFGFFNKLMDLIYLAQELLKIASGFQEE